MKRLNTLNDYIRVATTRLSLLAALLTIVVTGGLIGCSDRDTQARTTRTTETEGERHYQSEEVRASHRDLDAAQYQPDNTGRNVGDRAEGRKTADDQAIGGKENEILANIRREIVANESMSTYAKNVKIVIEDGTITLRGPVNSLNEKQWIERTTIAKAPDFRVINQLEVKEPS